MTKCNHKKYWSWFKKLHKGVLVDAAWCWNCGCIKTMSDSASGQFYRYPKMNPSYDVSDGGTLVVPEGCQIETLVVREGGIVAHTNQPSLIIGVGKEADNEPQD